jgi:hypothetical protein
MDKKELLFIDLCARLPYGVKVLVKYSNGKEYNLELSSVEIFLLDKVNTNVKPYLHPMSSMTEEEREEYTHITLCDVIDCEAWNEVDWLNAHHFDYRGLIEKDLAIEAPEGMYNN